MNRRRREGPVTHSAALLESTGVRSPGRSPVYEATAPLAASRQDARPHDPVRVAKGPATLRNSVFHPGLADASLDCSRTLQLPCGFPSTVGPSPIPSIQPHRLISTLRAMTGEPPARSAVPERGSRPHFCISWRKMRDARLGPRLENRQTPGKFVVLRVAREARILPADLDRPLDYELAVLAAPFRGYVDVDCAADILAEIRGVPVAGRIHATAELETPDIHGLTVRRGNSSHYQRDCEQDQPHVRLPLLVPRCSGLQSSSDLLPSIRHFRTDWTDRRSVRTGYAAIAVHSKWRCYRHFASNSARVRSRPPRQNAHSVRRPNEDLMSASPRRAILV